MEEVNDQTESVASNQEKFVFLREKLPLTVQVPKKDVDSSIDGEGESIYNLRLGPGTNFVPARLWEKARESNAISSRLDKGRIIESEDDVRPTDREDIRSQPTKQDAKRLSKKAKAHEQQRDIEEDLSNLETDRQKLRKMEKELESLRQKR